MKDLNLQQVPLFKSLPPSEIEFLAGALKPVTLDPGEVLFREGEKGDRFYIITNGSVEIIKAIDTPDERVLDVRGQGDFFGEMSLLNPDGLRTASIRARTQVHMMEMSRDKFDHLLERRPSLVRMVRVLSRRLADSDNAMIRDLTEKNRQLAQAYQELQLAQEQIIEKEKLDHELDLARRIQESILPNDLALSDCFEFGARMLPARAVGGDLYDFMPLDENRIGITIGDVSDKGVPAAIFMALFCSLLRAEAPHSDSPADALLRVNRHLMNMRDTRMFVTCIYGILDCTTLEFAYARAGHHVPVIVSPDGGEVEIQRDDGQLLGFFPEPMLDVNQISIPAGGTLVLYTDGMFDVMDAQGLSYGEEKFRETVLRYPGRPAQDTCDQLIRTLQEYQGDREQFDDMTLLAVKSRSDSRG